MNYVSIKLLLQKGELTVKNWKFSCINSDALLLCKKEMRTLAA